MNESLHARSSSANRKEILCNTKRSPDRCSVVSEKNRERDKLNLSAPFLSRNPSFTETWPIIFILPMSYHIDASVIRGDAILFSLPSLQRPISIEEDLLSDIVILHLAASELQDLVWWIAVLAASALSARFFGHSSKLRSRWSILSEISDP